MARYGRFAVTALACLSLAVHDAVPAFAAPELTRKDYESCQARDEASFRSAIEAITVEAMQKGLVGVDYKALVGDEWRKNGLDEIVDKRVDAAIAEVTNETSTWDRLRSNLNAETAKLLAEKVAERVYRSDAIKAAVETLTVGVAREVGKSIELATQDAAEPALACLQAFLGPRYGVAVARAVSADAGREFNVDPGKGGAEIGTGTVLRQSSEGITGAAILLVRRQLANMAARVGQRLAGSVLSRLVSVAAGGVGLVLIAKDLWDLSGGVFPIIATEMKSADTKAKVQEELAKVIGEQIGDHIKEIGAKTAERVADVWQEFRRAHLKVLELAERNASFKFFLNSQPPQTLPRLDEVVALILGAEGEAGLMTRLGDGSLGVAVNKMPVPAMDIARETRSIETGLKWSALAGDNLNKVVEFDIYRRAKPDDFTKATLARVLNLGDRLAVTRMAAIPAASRDALFEVDSTELKTLARSLTEAELDTLARYLTGLQKEPRELILKAVANSPAKMHAIASPRVRDGILASRDQTAAVSMMLRSEALIDPAKLADDFRAGWEGRISPVLLYEKHPGTLVVAAVLALMLLSLVLRLLRPRRSRAVTKAPAEAAKG